MFLSSVVDSSTLISVPFRDVLFKVILPLLMFCGMFDRSDTIFRFIMGEDPLFFFLECRRGPLLNLEFGRIKKLVIACWHL